MFDTVIVNRRQFLALATQAGLVGLGSLTLARSVLGQARKTTLVIGYDIADSKFMDPARVTENSTYMALHNTYEALVTMPPNDYSQFRPLLAVKWERTADGKGMRFYLRDGVKFASGNPLTATDVKFTYDRVKNLKDQPSAQFTSNVERVDVVDARTVDIIFKDPTLTMLGFIGSPQLAIQDMKEVMAHGGTGAVGADQSDKATEWLNQTSAGTGPYQIVKWERNSSIELVRNRNYWQGPAPFERIVIRHIPDNASQLLAIQRGDIDIAFNLLPDQIPTLEKDPNIVIIRKPTLDFMYMTLTSSAEINPALAKKEARQAVAYAIDYDGIINSLLSGAATRPLNFIPVGMAGSSEKHTKEFGYQQDLNKARALLAKAGLTDGFSFDLAYGGGMFNNVSYEVVAQKVQADVARVGIKVQLKPMNPTNFRTIYVDGKSTSVLTYWGGNMDVSAWTLAAVERVAKRVHWDVPPDTTALVRQAMREEDIPKQQALWLEFQKRLADQCNYIVLLQTFAQNAARKNITGIELTAVGGLVDFYGIKQAA